MLDWLLGPRLRLRVRILGVVGDRMVRWEGPVALRAPATLAAALAAAGRASGADLAGALAAGQQPSILLNDERLTLPDDLQRPAADGDQLTWLMPMAGG